MDDNDPLAIPEFMQRKKSINDALDEVACLPISQENPEAVQVLDEEYERQYGPSESEPEKLAECEVVLKSSNRSSGGIVMKFLVKPEDYTAVMAVLPLNEPMTLKLEKMEVGA